ISWGENAIPCSCITCIPSANERWPMCSTPPPITASWTPEATSAAPKLTACWAEPHWRSTVVAGGVTVFVAPLPLGPAPDGGADRLDDHYLAALEVAVRRHFRVPPGVCVGGTV